ncbi:MAG: hypothetical protein Q8P91_00100 [bacterium]|nr:hypothetical protein [bacterium]
MKMLKDKLKHPFAIIFLATLILFIPIFVNPSLILDRGNDLEEFFWPIYYFVKNQIINNHQIPLWNNTILSGTPLLPDPQAPIFYPLNILALIIPLDAFFVLSFFIHILVGGIAMYLCSIGGFRFSKKTGLILALLYITTPKLAGYLEAGHVGLINSMAWIPIALYAAIKLSENPKLKHSIILAISLSLIFYSHLPTFLIATVSAGAFIVVKSWLKNKQTLKQSLIYLFVAGVLTFGLTAASLLPQLEFQKESTRYLLLSNKDVYPKWNTPLETVTNAVVPWKNGVENLQNINSEKWIALGVIPTLLSLLGFMALRKKSKIIVFSVSIALFLLILNNSSPVYSLLLSQKWYLLLRVSTRFWTVIIILSLYLTGVALEKVKFRYLYLIAIFGIVESFALGFLFMDKPINVNPNMANESVYEYLSKDKSLFRVYCTTRCLSQKESAIYNLELLDGYNTIQQKNFNQQAWQLTGSYWNYYTLSIPPIGIYTFEKPQPDAKSLGEYNVKYLISPYPLSDESLTMVKKIDNFFIYENGVFTPRTYKKYEANSIKVNVANTQKQLIIPEVYSPGWKAYLYPSKPEGRSGVNDTKEVPVQETPNALRAVDVTSSTEYVDFKYQPKSYKVGIIITAITIILLLFNRYLYNIYRKTTLG